MAIKLNPSPSFDWEVSLTVPGKVEPEKIKVKFKYMTAAQMADWFKRNQERHVVAALSEIVDGWSELVYEDGQAVLFSQANLATLLTNYQASACELVQAWQSSLMESRVKN